MLDQLPDRADAERHRLVPGRPLDDTEAAATIDAAERARRLALIDAARLFPGNQAVRSCSDPQGGGPKRRFLSGQCGVYVNGDVPRSPRTGAGRP